MPLYSYRCIDCGQLYERVAHIKDRDAMQECPLCKSIKSKRLIDAPNINPFIFEHIIDGTKRSG